MQGDLIIDVGMHRGNDTEFYLAKGFRVVAVEANPELARRVEKRLATHLDAGKLRIHNVAVADRAGTTTLWLNDVNDDWGTTTPEFAERNRAMGTTNHPISVPCRTFEDILDESGTPYYLKIDIEGADLLCLDALAGRELPKYVSIEADLASFDGFFTQLSTLWGLGYRQFKILNQGVNRRIRCPYPPREGQYVDFHFDKDNLCSGLFGEETQGNWLTADQLLARARGPLRDQRNFGMNGRHANSLWGRGYKAGKWLLRQPVAWYDLHARTGAEAPRLPRPVPQRAIKPPDTMTANA